MVNLWVRPTRKSQGSLSMESLLGRSEPSGRSNPDIGEYSRAETDQMKVDHIVLLSSDGKFRRPVEAVQCDRYASAW